MVTLNKKKLFQIENLIEKFDPVIIFVQECDIADDYDIKLLNIKGYTTEMGQNLCYDCPLFGNQVLSLLDKLVSFLT